MTVPPGRWFALAVVILALAATALRIEAAARPGLWADEIFSLAMATGHSLEHPAHDADPALGDFVQPGTPQAPESFRRYAEHEPRPAGAGRVIRAVLLSDTSPPLYYVLLNGWTRWLGTGDASLRLFSVWWAVVSLPLLWLLGRDLAGPRAAWSACLLFSFAPVAVHFSVEGRMYSLLWCLVLALGWSTIRLADTGDRRFAGLWVIAGIAGLLTHYFFAFVWLACAAWLWIATGRAVRRRVATSVGLTVLAVVPWYLHVPAILARWRVSGDWLDGSLPWPRALARPFALAGSLVSGTTSLGGWRWADRVAVGLLLLTVFWMLRQRSTGVVFARRGRLLWAWLAAACAGPVIFDLVRHTTTSDIPRYALPGLPAAILLIALASTQLPERIQMGALALVVLAWLPAARAIAAADTPRPGQPYRALDARLEAWARPGDVVLVRSIPSGVIGVARYLDRDIALAPWVGQLGTREVPADLVRLLHGHQRVAVASIHDLGAPNPLEPWLRTHARYVGRETFRASRAEIAYFEAETPWE